MPRPIIFTACFLAVASISNTNSFGLVFARAAEGLGLEVAALGGLRTIENVASIVAALLVAPMIDRFPRKVLLLAGFAQATIAPVLLVLLDNVFGAILFFILNGSAMMQIFGALMAMPGDFITGRQLNRMMGLIIGCIAFTSVLVAPIVGRVADVYGWQAGMLVSSSVTGFAFLITLAVIPGYRVTSGDQGSVGYIQRYRAILGRTSLLLMLGSNMLRFAQLAAMMTFLSTILLQRYGISLSAVGVIFAGVGVMFFSASLLSGIILHRVRTWRVLIWGGITIVVLLVTMLVNHLPLWLMVPCVLLFIGVVAAQESTGTIAVLRLGRDARGAAMSWNELAAGIGALIGIGSGSIGLAIGGVSGLGVALSTVALGATIVSYVALRQSRYSDDDDPAEAPRLVT